MWTLFSYSVNFSYMYLLNGGSVTVLYKLYVCAWRQNGIFRNSLHLSRHEKVGFPVSHADWNSTNNLSHTGALYESTHI
jgi:hypothetical protein